jgi:hypothetical protein
MDTMATCNICENEINIDEHDLYDCHTCNGKQCDTCTYYCYVCEVDYCYACSLKDELYCEACDKYVCSAGCYDGHLKRCREVMMQQLMAKMDGIEG